MTNNKARAFWMTALIAVLSSAAASVPAHAAGSGNSPSTSSSEDSNSRNFYEVLDDVLGDFEYDLRNGNVTGLKELSIRNIATSENVPPSFKSHLELLVTERILKTTKTRVIQCLACRAKRATLNGDRVLLSSNENNGVELSRIAKENGISHFMDVAFAYQPNGIILSLHITEPDSGAVTWTRTYNSETSRSAAVRRGVDYTQVDESIKQTEYVPTVQYRAVAYYLMEPNVGSTTGCLGAGFRMVERYDNRKKEVGFEMDFLRDSGSLVSQSTTDTNLYAGMNLSLLFVHAWNLIGDEENYNRPRASVLVGVGGTYASGFLGGLFRTQYEWRLGKHYAVTPTLGYRPKSTAFISSLPSGTAGGLEAGIGISLVF